MNIRDVVERLAKAKNRDELLATAIEALTDKELVQMTSYFRNGGIVAFGEALSTALRRIEICCGDIREEEEIFVYGEFCYAGRRVALFRKSEVLYVMSDAKNSVFKTRDREHTLEACGKYALKHLAAANSKDWIMVHRKFLVPIDNIKTVINRKRQTTIALCEPKIELPVSRRRIRHIMEAVKKRTAVRLNESAQTSALVAEGDQKAQQS